VLAKTTPHVDPQVLACTHDAVDGPDLMRCLGSLSAERDYVATDAGRRPMMAALAPVPPSKTSWLVPDWHFNLSTGSDNNTCVDAAHSCKTIAEVQARLQSEDPGQPQNTTWHVHATDTAETFSVHPQTTAGAAFTIQGDLTTVATVTLSGVVAKNRPGSQALNANLGSGAAGYVDDVICNTTHPSCASVDSIVTGNVALITQPTDISFSELDTWANGDSVTISSRVALSPTYIANAFLYDVKFTTGATQTYLYNDLLSQDWIDTAQSTTLDSCSTFDVLAPGGPSLFDDFVTGGSFTGVELKSHGFGSTVTGDAIGHSFIRFFGTGDDSGYKYVYSDGSIEVGGGVINPDNDSAFYGHYFTEVGHGQIVYSSDDYPACVSTTCLATRSFYGVTNMEIFTDTVGTAIDRTTEFELLHGNIAITPAALDLAVSAGGFDGIALGQDLSSGYVNRQTGGTSTPTPSDLCPTSGTYLTGRASPRCDTPAGTGCATCTTITAGSGISVTGGPSYTVSSTVTGGVSSVTGSSGMACSPTTGAVACTNTGATSVTAGAGLSCSPTTGAVTCSNTGVTSLSATPPLSASTSTGAITVSLTQPSGTGEWYSISGALNGSTVTMGGDVSQGSLSGSTVPLTVGKILGHTVNTPSALCAFVYDGSDFDCSGPLSQLSGGTGLNAVGAAGNVLTSNGSTWVSSLPGNLFDEYDSSYNSTCATAGTTATTNTFTARAGHLDISVDVPTVGLGSGGSAPGSVSFQVFVGSTLEASWSISVAALSVNNAGGSWHGWVSVPATSVQVQVDCFGNFPTGTSGAQVFQVVKSYGF
jgi:hypothetical protein